MAEQRELYKKLRTEDGKIILERNIADELPKAVVLSRLNERLQRFKQDRRDINKQIQKIEARIAEIEAII